MRCDKGRVASGGRWWVVGGRWLYILAGLVGVNANCKRQSTLSPFCVPGFRQGDDYDAVTRFLSSFLFFIFVFFWLPLCRSVSTPLCMTNPINNPRQLFVFHVRRVCRLRPFEISMNFKLKLPGHRVIKGENESGVYWYVSRGCLAGWRSIYQELWYL